MKRARAVLSYTLALSASLLLASCGGGGGGGSSSVPAPHPASSAPAPAGQTAQVTLRINTSTIPSSNARTPKFVSPSAQSLTVTLQGQTTPLATASLVPPSQICSNGVCAVTFAAPVGNDTFVVTMFDGASGTGNQLSTAVVPFNVVANATNAIPAVLNGVVANSAVVLATSTVPVGAATTVLLAVIAYDAQQNIIVGPGSYSTPVTLTDTDSSGVTSLTANGVTGPAVSITAPGTSVTLNYNGRSIASATITPSVGGVSGTAATFAPSGSTFSTFSIPVSSYVDAMTAGPDGNVWIGGYGYIAKSSTSGSVTAFQTNIQSADIYAIATWAGAVWFGDSDNDIATIDGSGNVNYLQGLSTPLPDDNDCGGSQEGATARRSGQSRRGIRSTTPAAVACGEINWMLAGPDNNLWFTDDDGYIGQILPNGTITEWDISELPGFSGAYTAEPAQFAFGGDGNIYAADYSNGIEQIVMSGGVPSSVTTVPISCSEEAGNYALAIGSDNVLWTADECSNLYAIPMGTPFNAGAFSVGNMQTFPVGTLTSGDSFGMFQTTPFGIFAIDFSLPSIYRINEVVGGNTAPGVNTIQPVIATFSTSCECSGYAVTFGPDGNIWAGYNDNSIAKGIFGSPGAGLQSLLRAGPKSTGRSRNAAKVAHRLRRHRH